MRITSDQFFSFPGCLQTSLHRAHCYLPCPATHVISHDPHLVPAAVHALCDRDPSDMQACRQMNCFSPAHHSSVMAEVGTLKSRAAHSPQHVPSSPCLQFLFTNNTKLEAWTGSIALYSDHNDAQWRSATITFRCVEYRLLNLLSCTICCR